MLAGLLLAGVLPGCAGDRAVAAEVDAAAEAELRQRPEQYVNGDARAWAVRRDGAERGTLWGTIHLPYSGELVMPRPIRDRFGASASLTVEDLRQPPARAQALRRQLVAALNRPDPAAVQALDPATRAALRASGVREEDEAKHSLTGLSVLAASRAAAPRAAPLLPGGRIVDASLVGFARSVRIPVGGLEALEALLVPAFLDPNGPPGASALRLALRRLGTGAALQDAELAYYGRGDVARVLAADVAWRAMPDDLAAWEESRQMLLVARNRAWVAPLERVFGQEGTHFVAFGCGHLPGTDGVVALLRERGWDVRHCAGDRCG